DLICDRETLIAGCAQGHPTRESVNSVLIRREGVVRWKNNAGVSVRSGKRHGARVVDGRITVRVQCCDRDIERGTWRYAGWSRKREIGGGPRRSKVQSDPNDQT